MWVDVPWATYPIRVTTHAVKSFGYWRRKLSMAQGSILHEPMSWCDETKWLLFVASPCHGLSELDRRIRQQNNGDEAADYWHASPFRFVLTLGADGELVVATIEPDYQCSRQWSGIDCSKASNDPLRRAVLCGE